jgi:DNA-binding transcriptional ArsR family regulator
VSAPADEREQVFDALADPTRRRMLSLLGDRGTATATELAAELPVTRQAVAKHLGALAAVGLVEPTRDGREVRYRLTPEPLSGAMAWMATVGGRWDTRLADLRERLDET